MAMLVINILFWLIVESLQDTIIVSILTFGVFGLGCKA
jgi:hypothetical protein